MTSKNQKIDADLVRKIMEYTSVKLHVFICTLYVSKVYTCTVIEHVKSLVMYDMRCIHKAICVYTVVFGSVCYCCRQFSTSNALL